MHTAFPPVPIALPCRGPSAMTLRPGMRTSAIQYITFGRFFVKKIFCVSCCAFAFLVSSAIVDSGLSAAGQERLKKTETHRYTLYPAPGGESDPYSLQFPIKLDEPGLISVNVEVGGGKIKGGEGSPFKVWIVEAEGIQNGKTNNIQNKYIKKKERFKTKESINYAVDTGELARTGGEYVVLLSNLGKGSHAVGTIIITYPAEEKKDSPGPRTRHKRD